MGYWKDKEDIRSNWALSRSFMPSMEVEKREALLIGWHKAVGRSQNWAE